MSDIKNSVVSLETAKKLVEAGIVVDSVFCFYHNFSGIYQTSKIKEQNRYGFDDPFYPAPMSEEFVIPESIKYDIEIQICDDGWVINRFIWNDEGIVENNIQYRNPKLCEAIAELLIESRKMEVGK